MDIDHECLLFSVILLKSTWLSQEAGMIHYRWVGDMGGWDMGRSHGGWDVGGRHGELGCG